MNKKVRIVLYSLLVVFLLGVVGSGLLLLPSVQSYLGHVISAKISQNMPQDISVDSVAVYPNGKVMLKGVLVKDHHKDTLAYVPRAYAWAGISSLLRGRISISRAELKDPQVHIKTYKGEKSSNIAIFFQEIKPKKKSEKATRLSIGTATMIDGHVCMTDYNKTDTLTREMSVSDVDVLVRNIKIDSLSYSFDLKAMSAQTNMGVDLENARANVNISQDGIIIDDVEIETPRSFVNADASIYFPKNDTLSTFGKKIKQSSINIYINKCDVNPADVSFFFPKAKYLPVVSVWANASYDNGVVDVKKMRVWSDDVAYAEIFGKVNIADTISKSKSKMIVSNIDINTARVVDYYNLLDGKKLKKSDIGKINALTQIKGSGVISTSPSNATFLANLRTHRGNVFFDSDVKHPWDKIRAEYTAHLSVENVDMGLLSEKDFLGRITLISDVKGRGYTKSRAQIDVKAYIPFAQIKGYTYSGVRLSAHLNHSELTTQIEVDDPNLQANVNNVVINENGVYHDTGKIFLDQCNLHALNLVKDSLVNVRGTIENDIYAKNLNDVLGNVVFSEVSYNNGSNYYYIDRVEIASTQVNTLSRRLTIDADDIFNGYVQGNYLLTELPSTFTNAIFSKFKVYQKKKVTPMQNYSFEVDVTASNIKIINTPLIFDGTTHIDGRVVDSGEAADINILAQRVNYNNVLLDTLTMALRTDSVKMLDMKAQKLINPMYSMENFTLSVLNHGDSLSISSDFYKWNSDKKVFFRLRAYEKEEDDGTVMIGFLPSDIQLQSIRWDLGGYSPTKNRVLWNVNTNKVEVDSLMLTSDNAYILAQGYYDSAEKMDLNLHVHDIDLSRSILVRKTHPLLGVMNGDFRLYRGEGNTTVVPSVAVSIKGLGIDTDVIGDISVAVKANLADKYISTAATLINGKRTSLKLDGGLNIVDKKLVPDICLTLDSLNLAPVHYLLPSVFNTSSGYASAHVDVTGDMSNPTMNGFVTLYKTRLGIAFTNVAYDVDDGVSVPITNSFFYFKKVGFKDAIYGTDANMSGSIFHDNYKTWHLDLALNAYKALVLNTTDKNNERFYGKVFATGTFDLTGPTNTLLYDIKGKTEKGTVFCIDVGSTSDFKSSEMIEFVPPKTSHVDSLLLNLKKKIIKQEVVSTNEMNINIEAEPEAVLQIYMDKAVGHMLEGRGKGKMYMHLSPKGTFTMDGHYELASGNYDFVYQNLFKRKFTLIPGGNITFDSDPSNPLIDFSATYKTNTKPAAFLTTVSENAREEVLMTIHLTGALTAPVYTFNIEMPKAAENVREELAYRISDQEQLNQQFISLMALNTFSNTGGENQNPNMVATGVAGLTASMLSNQFSNIVQRFVNDIDINVNLNTSTDKYTGTTGSTDFEVAISKKLFNDRVTVNGVVGVPTGSSQSNLVGDVEVEYNISNDG
ncbi:MAG: translocation/assembly module TamB domain-containing protein, partial [Flavobacteriales bacterium]|nr:translocation/assembly module TamB domain-containing protein [Flavobacteriales bacterium]